MRARRAIDLEVLLLVVDVVVLAGREQDVVGHVDAVLLQDAVGLAPVEEQLLLLQVVEDEGPAERDVLLRLLQREAGRVEGNQRLAPRPLLEGLGSGLGLGLGFGFRLGLGLGLGLGLPRSAR